MRRVIETAPRDGKLVILEDDTARTFELGRWSTRESTWLGEGGKPLAITPTHWLPRLGDASLEGDECLPRKGSERCGPSHLQLRSIVPSTDPDVLQRPPTREEGPTRQNDSFGANEPRTVVSQPQAPAWSSLEEGFEHPAREAESFRRPKPPDQSIIPSSDHSALEWVAQGHAFELRNDVTLPVVEPRTVATQPEPPTWSCLAQGDEPPEKGPEGDNLPDPGIRPILPFPSGRVARKGREKEDVSAPRQDFAFPGIEPRTSGVRFRSPTWRRYAIPIAAAMIALSLIVIYLRAPTAAYVMQSARPSDGAINEPPEQLSSLDGRETRLERGAATALQLQKPNHENTASVLKDRLATLSRDLAASRQENEVHNQKALAAERDRNAALKSLQGERERAEALARELAKTRGLAEDAARDEARQLKRAPEVETAELQQSGVPLLRYAQAPSSLGWSVFRGQGGAVVDVPLRIFVQDAGPTAKGVGRRLKSADGRSEFAAYTLREPGQTPASYLRNNLAIDPATISYKRVTNRFFALSSESEGRIYYSRCNFYNAIHCIYLEYPQSEKIAWDAVVTRISRSLRRGI